MNADGSDPRPLTDGLHVKDQPAVSLDGETIAYRSTEQSGPNIYLMGRDGADPRQFTREAAGASRPVWFPDGRLAYLVRRRVERGGTVGVVQVADLVTGETRDLTPLTLSVTDLAISSGGDLLALVVQAEEDDVIVQKLYLFPLGGVAPASPVEVPRASASEMLLYPAFRP